MEILEVSKRINARPIEVMIQALSDCFTESPFKEHHTVPHYNCSDCGGVVRAAIPDYLKSNTKARNEFMKEVFTYNLSIKEVPLDEFKKSAWCECEDSKN